MKKIYLIVLLNCFVTTLVIAQNFEWAKNMGDTLYDSGLSVVTDNNGNVYTTGFFAGKTDFDPGPDSTYLTTISGGFTHNLFVQKMDANGNLLWVKFITSTSPTEGYSISLDANNNVYVVGNGPGTINFNPGAGTPASSMHGPFILKYDVNGNFIWARQLTGGLNNRIISITTDGNGDVYTTGYINGIADFDPGTGTYNIGTVGAESVFILKLSANGTFLWAKALGNIISQPSVYHNEGRSIVTDGSGNVYLTGYFVQTIDFDPGPGTHNLTSLGFHDGFILKLDGSGNFIWAKSIGSIYDDSFRSITVDSFGNSYTMGYFDSTVDFDPGAGTFSINSIGLSDIFTLKLDTNGDFVWVHRLGSTDNEYAVSIVADPNGDTYSTGRFNNSLPYNTGAGTNVLTSAGVEDSFIQKLDANGNFVWIKQIMGPGYVQVYDIARSTNGSIYTTGVFGDTADFDPGLSTYNLESNGSGDIFVLKLGDPCNNITNQQSIAICSTDSILLGGSYQYTSGIYTDTLITPSGCDSIITSTLTVELPAIANHQSIAICSSDSILLGGSYQYTSGIYTDTLTTASGCDSIIISTLTIGLPAITNHQSIAICSSDSILLGGSYQYTSGTYNDTLVNTLGCDSIIVTTILTVNLAPVITITNDATLSACNDIQLNANGGNTYTWTPTTNLSCSNCPNPIASPSSSITYSVSVTENGCSSSADVNITVTDESDLIIPNIFTPNFDGVNDNFNFTGGCVESITKRIYNRWGQLIFESNQIKAAWDGRTTAGIAAPDGVYYYTFEVEMYENGVKVQKSFTGSVSLFR